MTELKTKLNLEYDWLIAFNKSEDFLIDTEYYSLKLQSYKQNCLSQIKEGKYCGFLELIYHAMNLNSFIVDNKLYNLKFEHIDKKPIGFYIRELKTKQENSDVLYIAKIAQEIFKELLLKYLEVLLVKNKDHILIFNNNKIHTLKKINILIHEYDTNNYQLWQMSISNSFDFLNKVNFVNKFKITNTTNIEKHLKKGDPKINKDNLVGIDLYKEDNIERSVCGIRDTIILNRIFKLNNKFTAAIFLEISNYIKANNVFDYRLSVPA